MEISSYKCEGTKLLKRVNLPRVIKHKHFIRQMVNTDTDKSWTYDSLKIEMIQIKPHSAQKTMSGSCLKEQQVKINNFLIERMKNTNVKL